MKILPLGSIVRLKDSHDTMLMVVGRASLFKGKNEIEGYFDYSKV
ncbi:DUF4176 domain-containing protein [Companilactobacillus mishanensis]|uniref:DUF4176 domain-containing protein n=1 Tax=Companilactobacillus mishanensis TaxID=2486008 RepID=A0A5P0ZKE9_9LACO|nr:DUF4176 domain-containing protein [Companilactobacillus mishanensis]